ncbi:MAG: metallophosphoesterase [Acidimicrobiales bacterium]
MLLSALLALALGVLALVSSPAAARSSDDHRDRGRHERDHSHWDRWRPRPTRLVELQLLAFNDYHGHVQSDAAGTIDGQAAGGGEYLAAKLAELRAGKRNTLTVAAGDLIGGSPFFSGLFHDEPSVESLNAMHLDVSSVGNHEFDEGVTELLRMQNGGCHPVDGCYFPKDPFQGADFKWLAANVKNAKGDTPLPPYWIKNVQGVKVGFIGMTLEGTDAPGPGRHRRLELPRARPRPPTLVPKPGSARASRRSWCCCTRAVTPIRSRSTGARASRGRSSTSTRRSIPEIDVVITGHTHLPYNCVLDDRIVTSAYSFGRVVSR